MSLELIFDPGLRNFSKDGEDIETHNTLAHRHIYSRTHKSQLEVIAEQFERESK